MPTADAVSGTRGRIRPSRHADFSPRQSSDVRGRSAIGGKAHAASTYLFFYYLGSSVAESLGGLFYAAKVCLGVAAFVRALWAAGLLISWRLIYLEPLHGMSQTPSPAVKLYPP